MLLQAKIAIGLLLAAFLFWAYDEVGDRAVAEYKITQELIQAKADKEQREKYNTLEAKHEALKRTREHNERVITKQVEKVVTRDVYRNVCIDDDGLRIINEAIEGANSTKPETTMPSAPAD